MWATGLQDHQFDKLLSSFLVADTAPCQDAKMRKDTQVRGEQGQPKADGVTAVVR